MISINKNVVLWTAIALRVAFPLCCLAVGLADLRNLWSRRPHVLGSLEDYL